MIYQRSPEGVRGMGFEGDGEDGGRSGEEGGGGEWKEEGGVKEKG